MVSYLQLSQKKYEEEIVVKNREIQSLRTHVSKLESDLRQKTDELARCGDQIANVEALQVEVDESHLNEVKLLEQVEHVH